MFLVILMYAVSATTFMISKKLLMYGTPLFLSGVRTLLAGILFLMHLRCRDYRDCYKQRYIWPCLTVGFFSFYMSNTLKFWAMQYITSEKATIIAFSEPFFAILFAYFLCNEVMTIQRWIGFMLCIIGASFTVLLNNLDIHDGSTIPAYSFYTLTDIKAGDEILIDYNELNEPAHLQENYKDLK